VHLAQGDTVLIVKRQQPDLLKLSETIPEVFSDVLIFNQAAPSLPRKLPAVTLMEREKEATQRLALLLSSGGIASPRHTDTVLPIHPHVSASQERGRCRP